MKFRKLVACVALPVIALTAFVGCHGRFGLTTKWNGFVSSFGNKWVRWLVFLLTFWNIYPLAMIVDALILNSLEFWTGSNPVALHDYDKFGNFSKSVLAKNEKAILNYRKFGQELEIALYRDGIHKKTLLLKKSEPGVLYTVDHGTLHRIDIQEWNANEFKFIRISEGKKGVKTLQYSAREYDKLSKDARAATMAAAEAVR